MKKIFTILAVLIGLNMMAQPPGWIYNQPIQVQNPNAVNAVDYQLKLTVNTQSLIAANKMTLTGSDIRFGGTCTGSTFYNYWIEAGINTATTVIWVKIPLIAANTTSVIYMFYGNPGALPVSAIPGTFRGPNSATDSVTTVAAPGGLSVNQRGFRFAPTQNILVTDFGKNEPTGSTRYVTLFNYATQAILSQTQVAGPAATYTYGPINSPMWLTAGTQYVLQIFGVVTDAYYYATSSQIGQHLTYFEMQYSNGGTQNTFPTNTLANYHYGYGDFLYYITTTLAITPSYTIQSSAFDINGPSSLCSGNTVTLSTTATGSYTWSTGSTNSSITVSPSSNTTYSITQVDPLGCNAIALITLTVNLAAPVLTVSSSAATVCPNNTVALTATGALSYTWNNSVTNGQAFIPPVTTSYSVTGVNGCGSTGALITVSVLPLPVTASATSTLVCSGTAATLTAGGAATYTWLPASLNTTNIIINPAVNTTYTIRGVTGTCSGSTTILITTKPNPVVNIATTATTVCAGDAAVLTATGASTYVWTPGNLTGSSITINPSLPTLYSVVGTATNNCTTPASQVILVEALPVMAAAISDELVCVGGPSTLTASGANTYLWSNGVGTFTTVVNPMANTSYTVTGTSAAGCSSSTMVTVSVLDPTLSVSASTAVCKGGSANLTASGTDSFLWSNGLTFANITVTPAISTTYSITGTSTNGTVVCNVDGTVMVTVNPNPTVTALASRTIICRNETAVLTGSGAATYTWSAATPTVVATVTVAPLTTQNYTVSGEDANNCKGKASIIVVVDACTGLSNNIDNKANLVVYPNPANGEFTISTDQDIELQIFNEAGQLLRTISLTAKNKEIKINNLADGIYFITGKNDNGLIKQKIVINK